MARKFEEKLISILEDISSTLKNQISAEPKTSEDGRFIDNGDGTIRDTKLRLMWQKDGSETTMDFEDAQKYCKNSRIGNYKDWRLPTREELELILDPTKYDPAINPIFNSKSSYYWSSTPFADDTGNVWVVGFNYGSVSWDDKDYNNYVRPVRQY